MEDKEIKTLPEFLDSSCEAISNIIKCIHKDEDKKIWCNQWSHVKPLINQAKNKLSEVGDQLKSVGLSGEQLKFKLKIFEDIYKKFKEMYEKAKEFWEVFKSLAKLLLKAINIIVGSLVSISDLGLEQFKEFKEFLELKLEQDDLSQKFFDFKF